METIYILNTSDYTFSKFSDGGFSGKILLATPKKSCLPKLLIKSENPSSACNEFMYSRLAELLGILTPKAYIMNVAQNDAHRFNSPYVVGIEFMDGMHGFTLEEMRSSELWQKEYAEQYALAAMFFQDDLVQLTMRTDGHITGFDFTETFWLNDMRISSFNLSDDDLTTVLHRRLKQAVENTATKLRAGAAALEIELCLSKDSPPPDSYLAPMRALLMLTDEQVEVLTDVLCDVYPISVAVYFEEYIKALKIIVSGYLHTLKLLSK